LLHSLCVLITDEEASNWWDETSGEDMPGNVKNNGKLWPL
jgi:hypothetical protein